MQNFHVSNLRLRQAFNPNDPDTLIAAMAAFKDLKDAALKAGFEITEQSSKIVKSRDGDSQ